MLFGDAKGDGLADIVDALPAARYYVIKKTARFYRAVFLAF